MIPVARPFVGEEEKAAVLQVLESGQLASGPVTRRFEQAFAAAMGARHAVALANGTVAIQAAVQALGLAPGAEVLVPGFTFIATANAVLYAGARPVLCDVDPQAFTMDPAAVRRLVTPRTQAILPVHLYGLAADMAPLCELAEEKGLWVVGDAAQAHGATVGGRPVSQWADLSTWSLYPTKNVMSGEGGMVTTEDDALAAAVRSIVNHGRQADQLGVYDHVRLGSNFRLTDVHSAIGIPQLARMEAGNAARRRNAARYDAAFADLRTMEAPQAPPGFGHVYHQYTLRCRRRDAVKEALAKAGVGSAVYYPRALADFPHLADLRHDGLAVSRRLAQEVLSIPVHPWLTESEVEAVVSAVQAADRL